MEERKYCVYVHTNKVNGKKYVGVTSMKPEDRWKNGNGYPHNQYFTRAIKKYGWNEGFIHKIVAEDLSIEDAYQMEKELISEYNCVNPNGYNATSGGEVGKEYSEELRQRLSEIITEKMNTPEVKAKMAEYFTNRDYWGENNPNYGNHKLAGENNPNWGKHPSEETRKKMSEIHSNPSDETRRKLSDTAKARCTDEWVEYMKSFHLGKHPTEETRQKMSESQKARWTDEMRQEWGELFSGENNGMYGKHHSDKTKEILRQKLSGENSPNYRKKFSEEIRQKMSENNGVKREIIQFDLDGKYINEYESLIIAERATSISYSCISVACTYHYSAGGYLWRYKDEYNPNENISYCNKRYKAVVQLDLDKNFIAEYKNAREAERQTGVLHQNINVCCKNPKRTAGGYKWMYTEEYYENKNNTK